MKKRLSIFLVLALIFSLVACSKSDTAGTDSTKSKDGAVKQAWEPKQPITIMNYVASGGGMDLATRKFVEIAAKYTNATFVVDNLTGASGMIAADHVLSQPADGYLVYATTVTYIYAIAAAEEDSKKYIDGFIWTDNIMADPYCILVPKAKDYTLESLVAEAKAKGGSMVWCEPNAGGAKHIAAIQMTDALGINVKVVPYESGPLAIGAVLGGQGSASVGNPGDTTKYEVKAIVVANKGRLEGFDVPTFQELGYPAALDEISMWRGYAIKKGTPPEMISWFQNICQKVTEDPDWIAYFKPQFVSVKNDTTEAFTAQVKSDFEAGIKILKQADMISDDYNG